MNLFPVASNFWCLSDLFDMPTELSPWSTSDFSLCASCHSLGPICITQENLHIANLYLNHVSKEAQYSHTQSMSMSMSMPAPHHPRIQIWGSLNSYKDFMNRTLS